ncbi:MAG: signal peptidase II [Kineosporiaceae bacterium]
MDSTPVTPSSPSGSRPSAASRQGPPPTADPGPITGPIAGPVVGPATRRATLAATRRSRRAARRPRRGLVAALLLTAATVVLLDQLTKAWAVRTLGDGRTIEVVGSLVQLRLFRNPGAAFSFATGTTWIFTIIATVVSIVIVRISRRLGSVWWAVTLGLLLGGAVGNLLDRLLREPGFARGHVVDFIDLPRLFVFNLADASITVAAVLIAVLGLRGIGIDGRVQGGRVQGGRVRGGRVRGGRAPGGHGGAGAA